MNFKFKFIVCIVEVVDGGGVFVVWTVLFVAVSQSHMVEFFTQNNARTQVHRLWREGRERTTGDGGGFVIFWPPIPTDLPTLIPFSKPTAELGPGPEGEVCVKFAQRALF